MRKAPTLRQALDFVCPGVVRIIERRAGDCFVPTPAHAPLQPLLKLRLVYKAGLRLYKRFCRCDNPLTADALPAASWGLPTGLLNPVRCQLCQLARTVWNRTHLNQFWRLIRQPWNIRPYVSGLSRMSSFAL